MCIEMSHFRTDMQEVVKLGAAPYGKPRARRLCEEAGGMKPGQTP
jgi:hypothetical protein